MAVILVVDDEIGIRELLSEILSDEGYGVLLAENASAARSAMTQHPDLVLLDIWMPDNDGVSLLKEWNATGQLNVPVIMMSLYGRGDEIWRCRLSREAHRLVSADQFGKRSAGQESS